MAWESLESIRICAPFEIHDSICIEISIKTLWISYGFTNGWLAGWLNGDQDQPMEWRVSSGGAKEFGSCWAAKEVELESYLHCNWVEEFHWVWLLTRRRRRRAEEEDEPFTTRMFSYSIIISLAFFGAFHCVWTTRRTRRGRDRQFDLGLEDNAEGEGGGTQINLSPAQLLILFAPDEVPSREGGGGGGWRLGMFIHIMGIMLVMNVNNDQVEGVRWVW